MRCAYKDCKNVKAADCTANFFPIPNNKRRAIWLKHGQTEPSTKNPVFCEEHFYQKDILMHCAQKLLKASALPKSTSAVCSCSETSIDNECLKKLSKPKTQSPKQPIDPQDALPKRFDPGSVVIKEEDQSEPSLPQEFDPGSVAIKEEDELSLSLKMEVDDDEEATTSQVESISRSTSQAEPISSSTSQVTPIPKSTSLEGPISRSTSQVTPIPKSTSQEGPISRSTSQVTPIPKSTSQEGPISRSTSQVTPIPKTPSQEGPISRSTRQVTPIPKSTSLEGPISRSTSQAKPISRSTSQKQPLPTSKKRLATPHKPLKAVTRLEKVKVLKLEDAVMEKLKDRPADVQTLMKMVIFHKPDSDWKKDEKELCLRFYFKSPLYYDFLCKELGQMPPVSTLYRWFCAETLPAGFSNHVATQLKIKADSLTEKERKCILCLEEIIVFPQLHYNVKDDLIEGFTDLGELGRGKTVATKMMVFTLRGLYGDWMQTVSYYVANPTGERILGLLKVNIKNIFMCGLKVSAVCCDHVAATRSAYELLGAKAERPYFNFKGERIFLLYDYRHLFKGVRNCLLQTDIQIREETVSWKITGKPFQDASDKFFKVSNLTKSHVAPSAAEKLSTPLATQFFNSHVATAIFNAVFENIYEAELDRKYATSTATFLSIIRQLYEVLDTSSVNSNNMRRYTIPEVLGSINAARQWISLWECRGETKTPHCFKALDQTLQAIEHLWLACDKSITDLSKDAFAMVRMQPETSEENPPAHLLIRKLRQRIFKNSQPDENELLDAMLDQIDEELDKDEFSEDIEELEAIFGDINPFGDMDLGITVDDEGLSEDSEED